MNKFKRIFWIVFSIMLMVFVYKLAYCMAEPKAYDYMIRNYQILNLPFDGKNTKMADDNIVLVVIDNKTVEKYRWPWRRDLNCKIFEYFIQYAKPKVVVHDSVLAAKDNANPEADAVYFKTLSKFDNLIEGFNPLPQVWNDKAKGLEYDKKFEQKYSLKITNNSVRKYNIYNSMFMFPEDYYNVVKHAGSVSIIPGPINGDLTSLSLDEIYRTQSYLINYKGIFYPSLALKTFLIANDNPEIVLKNDGIYFPALDRHIYLSPSKYYYATPLKFYDIKEDGLYTHTKYSAVDIMDSYDLLNQGKEPIINPELFKDKIVIIGANVSSANSVNDIKTSPIMVNHPGVDIQATAIDNLMNNDFSFVVPQILNVLLAIIMMSLVYGIIMVSDLYKSVLLVLLLLLIQYIFTAVCFYHSIVINYITPVIMSVLTIIVGYTHKFINENKNKEKVKNAMGKYMSQDVMKRVIMNIDNLGLGGKKAIVTVLFADIRGFTSMSEQMSAQQVSEILNEYFTEMEPIISSYNGIINKFIGDAVMAIFGEPIQDKNHAQNAVKCAYKMLKRVKELQQKWIAEGKPKIEIGVGINTGEVFIGNIGSANRMEYTVIGDTVNLASRLESYNKIYKTRLLISQSTYEEAKGIVDTVKIPDVQIRGKSNKIDIYEILNVME